MLKKLNVYKIRTVSMGWQIPFSYHNTWIMPDVVDTSEQEQDKNGVETS